MGIAKQALEDSKTQVYECPLCGEGWECTPEEKKEMDAYTERYGHCDRCQHMREKD
jgi:hypothetical protein